MIELLLQFDLFLIEGRSDKFFLQFQLIVDIAFALVNKALLVLDHDLEFDYLLILLCPFLQRFL